MRRIGQLAAAAEAGYRIGRARRRVTAEDCYPYASARLQAAFWAAVRRGRAAAADLEQTTLALFQGAEA